MHKLKFYCDKKDTFLVPLFFRFCSKIMSTMKKENIRQLNLSKPKRSLIEIKKKINDSKIIADIMTIKGTGVIVQKPQWFKEFEQQNNKRWEKQEQFNQRVLLMLENIIDRLDILEKRMDKLERRMDSLEVRMDTLEARMTNLEKRINNIVAKNNLTE